MLGAAPTSGIRRRVERFDRAGSTNDLVRARLAGGEPEIVVAVAGEQMAGRGRLGRTWTAPAGAALLVSLGFRPTWLAPGRAWRLAAVVTLAMADAAEDAAGLPVGSIRCKWPNDLVIETAGPQALLMGVAEAADAAARLAAPLELRKLAGVLGETDGLGTDDPRVVVGIGVNADWAAADFPPELSATMTSLREASAGRPIDRDALLDGFLERLDGRIEALRAGYFDLGSWAARQAVTGRLVTLEGTGDGAARVPGGAGGDGRGGGDARADGEAGEAPAGDKAGGADEAPAGAGPGRAGGSSLTDPVRALGVDAETGGLVVEDPTAPSGERLVHAGEVVRVRLAQGPV